MLHDSQNDMGYNLVRRSLEICVSSRQWQRRFCQRCKQLSSYESYLSALRPFYLAVHPDFFNQHPKQKLLLLIGGKSASKRQAINEDSLKALHSYLDDLNTKKQPTPVKLKFFLRRKTEKEVDSSSEKDDNLHAVTIQLRSSDLSTSIHQLLHLCSLPIHDNVSKNKNNLDSKDSSSRQRKENWSYATEHFGKRSFDFAVDMDYTSESEQSKEKQNRQGDLPLWFLNNIPTARVRMKAAEPVISENKEIINRMKETLGLKSFILQTPVYSQNTLNGALKQLESLFLNKWSISSALLRRKILTVGNFNGVDHIGRLVFDITDVPSSWTEALTRMSDIDDLAEVLRVPELRISELMNGLKISRDSSSLEVFPIETYYRWVTKLLDHLKESKKNGEVMTGAYNGLKGQVTKPRMFASVSPEGDILIPCVTTMAILDRFLQKNFRIALEARRKYARSVKDELDISDHCREELGLKSLLKDRLITPAQMVIGCKRLLDCRDGILHGTRVIISNYYGITGDGDIRVPWEARNSKRKENN